MTVAENAAPTYIKGVPHALPAGERLLWEGAPSAGAVARHVFRVRLFAAYFALMLALWATSASARAADGYVSSFIIRLALGLIVLGVIFGLSQAVARTTWYAITDRRVVLRIGIVLPMSINIPFALLLSADVIQFRDGTGQLALKLAKEHRIAYIALWPHCRAFTFTTPSPLLRGLADPKQVGAILAQALAAASGAESVVVDRTTDYGGVPRRSDSLVATGA